jgi:hypothetical protein
LFFSPITARDTVCKNCLIYYYQLILTMSIIASSAFSTWYDKLTKLGPNFAWAENEAMEKILQFFSVPTPSPLTHFSVALRDEPGLVLGIDQSRTKMVLLHNFKVRPATRQNPEPIIRALYGLGHEATPVLIDPDILTNTLDIESPSVTAIRSAYKEGVTGVRKLKRTALVDGLGLILFPPFLAQVILDLPSLACDQVFAAVMDAITAYDKSSKTPQADEITTEPTQEASPNELPEDPIEEADDPDIVVVETVEEEVDPPPVVDIEEPGPSPRAGKKPSVFSRCGPLIKFLFLAQFQQLFKDKMKHTLIPGVIAQPTMELSHREWCIIRHVQANVNQANDNNNNDRPTMDPTSLFEKVSNPLNDIIACLEGLADKVTDPSLELEGSTPLKKLLSKFEPPVIEMFLRLSSTNGTSPAAAPQEFLVKFLTAKGTGGTGAADLLKLHNKRLRRNINMPIGCITAMHHGRFLWDHPTIPNNFSPFFTPRATVLDMNRAASSDLMNVQIRALLGKGMENSDISKITKQFLTVPSTVTDMTHQLANHNALQGDFWGPESMIHLECKKFFSGIEEYDAVYASALVHDPLFLSKIMYYYDLTLYRLYEECLIKEDFYDIRWEMSDLQAAHTKVLCGQFFQNLPPALQPPKPAHISHANPQDTKRIHQDRDPTRNVRQRPPRGTDIFNTGQHKLLMLHTNESFHDVVLRTQQIKLVPTWPGTNQSVCLNWHIMGRCHDNCDRRDLHKDLPTPVSNGLKTFLKACRASHKKTAAARARG